MINKAHLFEEKEGVKVITSGICEVVNGLINSNPLICSIVGNVGKDIEGSPGVNLNRV